MRISHLFHLTLRQKLFFGLGFNVLLVAAIVFSTIISMDKITLTLGTIHDSAIPQALYRLEIDTSIYSMVDSMEASILTDNQSLLDGALTTQRNLANPIGELILLLEKEPEALETIRQLDNSIKNYTESGSQLFRARIYNQTDQIPELQEKYIDRKQNLISQTTYLKNDTLIELESALLGISRLGKKTNKLTIILGSTVLVMCIFIVVGFNFVIIKPVNRLVSIMKQAEQGDFTARYVNPMLTPCHVQMKCEKNDCPAHTAKDLRCWQIPSTLCAHSTGGEVPENGKECDSCKVYLRATRDEFSSIGEAFNNMMTGISNIFYLLTKAASEVSVASSELLSLSEDLRHGSDQQARSVDEVTASIEEMNSTIRNMAESAETYYSSAEESNTSILEITASVEEVAHSAELLTGYVNETGTFIDEMTTSIREVAQHSGNLSQQVEQSSTALLQIETSIKEVVQSTKHSSELASLVTEKLMKEGNTAVDRTADSIVEIRETVTEAADVMRGLTQRSSDIGKILEVIEEVSDQTKLLSLNAAILAAQSGSQGRAFSVIAEEIRDLSERTSASTQEINQILSGMPVEIGTVTEAIQRGTAKVDEGVRLIGEVGAAINIVSDAAKKSAEASNTIMMATDEQASSIRQAAELEQGIAQMSREITEAMKYQTENCEKIISSADQMQKLASMVRGATDEQSKGTKLLSHTSNESMKVAQMITDATREEAKGSELILKSIDLVSKATSKNMEVFAQMSEMVVSLSEHSRMLHDEVGRFKGGEESSEFRVQSSE